MRKKQQSIEERKKKAMEYARRPENRLRAQIYNQKRELVKKNLNQELRNNPEELELLRIRIMEELK